MLLGLDVSIHEMQNRFDMFVIIWKYATSGGALWFVAQTCRDLLWILTGITLHFTLEFRVLAIVFGMVLEFWCVLGHGIREQTQVACVPVCSIQIMSQNVYTIFFISTCVDKCENCASTLQQRFFSFAVIFATSMSFSLISALLRGIHTGLLIGEAADDCICNVCTGQREGIHKESCVANARDRTDTAIAATTKKFPTCYGSLLFYREQAAVCVYSNVICLCRPGCWGQPRRCCKLETWWIQIAWNNSSHITYGDRILAYRR